MFDEDFDSEDLISRRSYSCIPCLAAYLKNKFPKLQIDWVVEKPFAEMVKAHPQVDNVLTINSKDWRKGLLSVSTWREIAAFKKTLQNLEYDAVFDLQGNAKSGFVCGLAKAKSKVGFSRAAASEWPNLLFTNKKYTPPAGRNIRLDYLSVVQQHYNDPEEFYDTGVRLAITQHDYKKFKIS